MFYLPADKKKSNNKKPDYIDKITQIPKNCFNLS